MIKISKLAYETLKDKNGNVHGNPILGGRLAN